MTPQAIHQLIEQAAGHHREGRLQQAEPLYRHVLSQQPNNADALRLLGILALQVGRLDTAIELLGRAIVIDPRSVDAHTALGQALARTGQLPRAADVFQQALSLNPQSADACNDLANALLGLGRIDEAMTLYRKALGLKPNSPQMLNNLGSALTQKSQFDESAATFERAIALQPDFPEAYCNLGIALRGMGQSERAIAAFQKAIALRPSFKEASLHLTNALRESDRADEAMACLQQALTFRPDDPDLLGSVGVTHHARGEFREALEAYRRVVAVQPNVADNHYNAGTALQELDENEQAIEAYRQAIKLQPDLAKAYNNMGNALLDVGRFNEAAAAYREAIRLSPEVPSAHFNMGVALLVLGDLAEGFREFEWRWRTPELSLSKRQLPRPRWNGQPLTHERLLLHAEQGFGDTIQFVRYVPLAAERGGKILLTCQPELVRLFKNFQCIEQIITTGQSIPEFDLHCPLLSLPLVFGTTLETIPAKIPYLQTDEQLSSQWRKRLEEFPDFKVGLVWGSRAAHRLTRRKSISPAKLSVLSEVEGVRFFSLQKGDAAKQELPDVSLIDWTGELTDFADTAALIENLDLIITVDTAVAHLAGALGKPVWVAEQFASDWRWMLDRNDSPWYPTMKLFRQPKPGDWQSVIGQISRELACLVQ